MQSQQLSIAWSSVAPNLMEVSSVNQVMKKWCKHYDYDKIVLAIFLGCILNRYQQRSINQLLSGWFCFVQTSDGKIVAVHHASNENNDAVDFKKSIAAAFQANFKGTEQEEEDDPQSDHISHYRYYTRMVWLVTCMHACWVQNATDKNFL